MVNDTRMVMNNLMRGSSYLVVILIALAYVIIPTSAQEEGELELRLNRDFGYSSGSGRIQGTFSMRVEGPDDLQRVVFFIDGEMVGEDVEAPFRLQFRTEDFDLGLHTFRATGYTADGRELRTAEIRREFVSAEEGWQAALRIAVPILAISLLVTLIAGVVPALSRRGKTGSVPLGAPRSYGILGGTVCPKCERPFNRHWWGFNIVIGKLDRCPHCGKWSVTQSAHASVLRAAEEAELALAEEEKAGGLETSEEEHLKRSLDESRYEDL